MLSVALFAIMGMMDERVYFDVSRYLSITSYPQGRVQLCPTYARYPELWSMTGAQSPLKDDAGGTQGPASLRVVSTSQGHSLTTSVTFSIDTRGLSNRESDVTVDGLYAPYLVSPTSGPFYIHHTVTGHISGSITRYFSGSTSSTQKDSQAMIDVFLGPDKDGSLSVIPQTWGEHIWPGRLFYSTDNDTLKKNPSANNIDIKLDKTFEFSADYYNAVFSYRGDMPTSGFAINGRSSLYRCALQWPVFHGGLGSGFQQPFNIRIIGHGVIKGQFTRTIDVSKIPFSGKPNNSSPLNLSIAKLSMTGPHTVTAELTGDTQGKKLPIRVSSVINGKPVSVDVVADLSKASSASVDIDLEKQKVPRFRDAVKFTVVATGKTSDGREVSDKQEIGIPLPVVLVKGISLKALMHLGLLKPDVATNDTSLDSSSLPGVRAYLLSTPPPTPFVHHSDASQAYQTVWSVNKDITALSLHEASNEVERTWESSRAKHWSDKCVLIAHSKGCLAAAALLSRGGAFVKHAVLAEGPFLGSLYAPIVGLRSLYPVWMWWRDSAANAYSIPKDFHNAELEGLLNTKLRTDVMYLFVYSNDANTPYRYTGTTAIAQAALVTTEFIKGDQVVPTFSQMGITFTSKGQRFIPMIQKLSDANVLRSMQVHGLHTQIEQQKDFLDVCEQLSMAGMKDMKK